MQKNLIVSGVEIRPGENKTISLPLARLYTHTEMTIPVHVYHGKKPGPSLFVCSAVHGDEINGVEILRRLLRRKSLRKLAGTLILVPIVNIYGFINRSRYLPDRRDLNRSFPGSAKGSLASQLARLLMDEIVSHCTHGIDLHTGSNHRSNLPQIRACLDDPRTEKFARAFGAPVILDARLRDGSLREAVSEKGIPMLLYETGEALRFDEVGIRLGLRGIISAMREIGLLPKRSSHKPPMDPLIARSASWVRAPMSGILSNGFSLGQSVHQGQIIGLVSDPISDDSEEIKASAEGVIISRFNLPLVHRGDALFQIASLEESGHLDLSLPALEQEMNHANDLPPGLNQK